MFVRVRACVFLGRRWVWFGLSASVFHNPIICRTRPLSRGVEHVIVTKNKSDQFSQFWYSYVCTNHELSLVSIIKFSGPIRCKYEELIVMMSLLSSLPALVLCGLRSGGSGQQLRGLLCSLFLRVCQLHGFPLHPAAARRPLHTVPQPSGHHLLAVCGKSSLALWGGGPHWLTSCW